MFKLTNPSLCFALISACFMAPAMADVINYGERQDTTKGGFHVVSNAEWVHRRGLRTTYRALHLTALRDSLPPGNQPQSDTARAGSILDFTQEAANGLPLNYLEVWVHTHAAGIFFKNTTEAVVRVEYTRSGTTQIKSIPLINSGYYDGFAVLRYDAQDLQNLGLSLRDQITIRRVAVVAKPKINKHVDDYASLDVTKFQYRVWNTQATVTPVDDLAIRNGNNDALLNGA